MGGDGRSSAVAGAVDGDVRARHGRRPDGCAVAAGLSEDAERAAAGGAQPGAQAGRVAVARLIYSAIASLDGYVEDAGGRFDWAAPDEEVHAFVNELERPVGTYLYGRRMYETMVFWERPPEPDQPAVEREYAEIWQRADKIVYSRRLTTASSARTRIEREFDAEAVQRLKARATHDLSVGGSFLA